MVDGIQWIINLLQVSNEIIYKNIPFPFNSTRIQKTPVRVQTIIFLWFI